jgi:hypothetical protein
VAAVRIRAATLVLGVLAAACTGGDDGGGAAPAGDGGGATTTTTTTVATTTTTEAPLAGYPPIVVEQGFSVFPDPIDPNATLGGFGAVLENPNPEVLAAGVSVTLRLLGADGEELAIDTSLLNGILPGQRMAVGRTLIEPVEDPVALEVDVDVAVFLLPAEEGTFGVSAVQTEPIEGGGFETSFTATSSWPTDEEGVDVAAAYRAEDGRLLAVERTTLPRLPAGGEVSSRIRLLAPIPDLADTEVFVGRGFAAQSIG